MQDITAARALLQEISDAGMLVTVDDFGKGYSSLSYLKRLPIHRLKIDRDFVKDLPEDGDDGQICRAIIALAGNLDIGLVAEGIETRAQSDFLQDAGCEFGQGYLFGRPMPSAAYMALIMPNRSVTASTSRNPFDPA